VNLLLKGDQFPDKEGNTVENDWVEGDVELEVLEWDNKLQGVLIL